MSRSRAFGRLPGLAAGARGLVVGVTLVLAVPDMAANDATNTPAPAIVKVQGLGIARNRRLGQVLREIRSDPNSETLDAAFVEDALYVLRNWAVNEGHLNAVVIGRFVHHDGTESTCRWDGRSELDIPLLMEVTEARFRVWKGLFYSYETIEFEGLSVLSESEARDFFFRSEFLLRLRAERRYSPARAASAVASLERELRDRGYRDARADVIETELDHRTGGVRLRIRVTEGTLSLIRSLEFRIAGEVSRWPEGFSPPDEGTPFSLLWQQDAEQALTRHFHEQGYPDARVTITESGRQSEDTIQMDLVADAEPGVAVELGETRFEGGERVSSSLLKRLGELEGPLLNRVAVDDARQRLIRLGVFRDVRVRFEPPEADQRDAIFELEEGRRSSLSLMAGYASYDQVFGGVEYEHLNVWGVGHRVSVRAVQSLKSSHGMLTYTLPEVGLRDLQVFGTADGLRREELTFNREELKLSLGVRRPFLRSGHSVGLRYSYELLDAETPFSTAPYDTEDGTTRAAAIIADWQLERRDNPLLPRQGFRVLANVEAAQPGLGGVAQYTRVEIGGSWHQSLSQGRILHVGLLHQFVTNPDQPDALPFNKRFFPGGENSVRGYQAGGASPLDEDGNQIGAESVLQWNIELEQLLTKTWSVVLFVDGVGVTPDLGEYPFDEVLWSAGLGIRWNTLIGPIRLEYGRNVNPRTLDPLGTIQFSIGYPF